MISSYVEKISQQKSIFGEIMAQNDVKKRQKIDIRPEKKMFSNLFFLI